MTNKDLADAKVPAYEQTCLPFTVRHTGRRGAGLTAAAAGRGGGACRAAGGGCGGGDVFIVCTGGLATVAGGGVLTVPAPLDGLVLVTLAPIGGVPFALCSFGWVFTDPVDPIVFVTFAPIGGPLARKSLAGGEVTAVPAAGARSGICLPTPDAGGELINPCAGARGRVDGGKPTPVCGTAMTGEVLTGVRCGRPGGGAGRLNPLAGARANAGSGRSGGGGGARLPPKSTTGRAMSGGGTRTNGGGLITTTGPSRGGATATTPSGGARGVSQ